MKNIANTFIITALTLVLGNAQCKLQITIKDCREENSYEYLSEFKLFKDNILVRTIKPKDKSEQTMGNLKYGSYRIDYQSMFGKIEHINLELTERKTYKINLCLDYLNYDSVSHTPFINLLEDGENYSIQVSSRGCFHQTEEVFIIKRKSNEYYLEFEGNEKLLSKEDIDAIRHFEMELVQGHSYGCTTMDTYTIQYKDHTFGIMDGGCDWNGDYYLKKKLKLSRE